MLKSARLAGPWILAVLLLTLIPHAPVHAQDQDSDLSIGGIEHTVVDGQHVIVVVLNNASDHEVEATGVLSVLDAGGLQVARVDVTTGPLVPDGSSVLAIPLPQPLPEGRYSLTLTLLEDPDKPPVHYGLRRFLVEEDGATGLPDNTEEPGDAGGFPSWLILVGGLTLIAFGLLFRRGGDDNEVSRPVPEVSMIRKVRVGARPEKGKARLRKLRPPDRQNMS